MDPDAILRLGREALMLVLVVSAVPMLVSLVVSFIVSVLQSATQVQESTLPVVPRLVAVYTAIGIGAAWMLREVSHFTIQLFELIGNLPR